MLKATLKDAKDLEKLVNEIGFLPLFASERTPYSVEGATARAMVDRQCG